MTWKPLRRHSQIGLQKALQQEWQFVQQVTNDVGPDFEAVEVALSRTFLPAPFGDDCDDPRHDVSCLPVKWPNPTLVADANCEASILTCSHILAAFQGVDTFRSAKHKSVIAANGGPDAVWNLNRCEQGQAFVNALAADANCEASI
jgi:hypothetical protein